MSELTSLLSRPRLTAAQLGEIHDAIATRNGIEEDIIRTLPLLDPPHICRPLGLLRMIAEDRGLDAATVSKILQHLDAMDHWLARLLCCQLLAITGCPRENEDDAFPFLADCFRDRRVIIRAWALTVLSRFTGAHHQKSIASIVASARKDPSKSMQARLRHISDPLQGSSRTPHS
jgi:hypothetical protein